MFAISIAKLVFLHFEMCLILDVSLFFTHPFNYSYSHGVYRVNDTHPTLVLILRLV
jgi:hypothetical protein